MNVFITGANGLLGSQICKLLLQHGVAVRASKRANSDLRLLGKWVDKIDWREADICDIVALDEAMQNCTHVIHCAALISFDKKDAQNLMQINVEGTANVVNAALKNNVKRVLHVSSVAAFGRPKGNVIIDEQLDVKDSADNFIYYRSKFFGEREIWRGMAEGLEVVIINPSTILGGGFWNANPNKLFAQVKNEYPFYTTGENAFVDVRDVSEVAVRLLTDAVNGEKFIVSAENLSLKAVMDKIAAEFGVKQPWIKAGKVGGAFAWRAEALKAIFTGQKPIISQELIAVAQAKFGYKNDKDRKSVV